jgi:hypothetical protein
VVLGVELQRANLNEEDFRGTIIKTIRLTSMLLLKLKNSIFIIDSKD